MSDFPFRELFEAITGLSALAAAVFSYLNHQKIEQVHKATNSLTDRLVIAEKATSRAEGVEAGRTERLGKP